MQPFSLPIYNQRGEEIESIKLNPAVFDSKVHHPSLYQAVTAYLARQRKGLAATKTRGEVSGGGRKPWRQKGTGRARAGSIRSPLWRHGGVTFGPHPRDFSYHLPKKIEQLALKSSLNAKLKENRLLVLNNLKIEPPKTKNAARIFSRLKANSTQNVLLLLDKIDLDLKRSLNNLAFLKVNLAQQTQAYEILAAHKVILTKEALQVLTERLK